MNDDATLTLMSIGRCFVGALHGPSDKANDKVSVVNWNSGIRGAITQILQRTTLRASYRHAAQHKCCARALSPFWANSGSDAYSRSRHRETAIALNRYRGTLTWSVSCSDGKSHFTTIGAREKIRRCVQPQGNSFLR
jgi:hypothetical protein